MAERASGSSNGIQTTLAQANSQRIALAATRLAVKLNYNGFRCEVSEVFNLCITLARGIDYAVTCSEVPANVQDLPPLIKQVFQNFQFKHDICLQSAIMLLMISVKNACRNGWFAATDTDDLLNLANEISSTFCSTTDVNVEPSSALHIISVIMPRYYPRMKMGSVVASLEAKPGYEILVADFYIPKSPSLAAQERIRLLVARRDNTETSTCIVTPPEVNFLLNGKSVERRTTVSMDYGPQFPTDVTPMLKYGTNLLQAIGNFDGNYIIVIAYMRAISPSDIAVLQDYVQPAASALSSDTEIIEGPSRISLNCPISFKRIKTPVKGHLCRHHQCFDYYNFMEINSRKPSWRCPHCNQPISFTDIRIDQNMAKVLREAGDDVSDVLISADGSWKVVTGLDHSDQNDLDDGSEQCQTMKLQNIPAAVVDLTMEDTDVLNETNSGGAETSVAFAEQRNVDSSETEDRKPLEDILEDLCSTENLTEPSFVNSASEAIQGAYQVGHDFWSRILSSTSATNGSPAPTIRTDAYIQSSSTTIRADTYVQFSPDDGMLTPMLTDAVPAAVNREPVDGRSMTQPIISYPNVPQVRQFVATENMQLQQSRFGNSIVNSETGRQLIPRHISRSPIAIQALPAQTQVSNSHLQRPRTSILSPNPMISRGASPTVPQTSSMSHTQDGLNAVGTDMEGQQILRSQMDPHSASDIASSSLQFHTMAQSWDHHGCQPQIVGLPPTSQISMRMPSDQQRACAFRSTLGLSLDHQNIHRQGPPNRVPQTMNEPASLLQHSRFASVQVQQPVQSVIGIAAGSSTNQFMVSQNSSQVARSVGAPVQLQGPRAVSSFAMPSDGLRQPIMDQRQNLGVMQSSDNLPELPSEKNWRPTGRMRGSLSGRALSSGLSQYIVQPTPPAQARPPPITTQANASTLQVLVAKSMNAHGQTPPSYSRTADGGAQGSLGSPSPQ